MVLPLEVREVKHRQSGPVMSGRGKHFTEGNSGKLHRVAFHFILWNNDLESSKTCLVRTTEINVLGAPTGYSRLCCFPAP